MNKNLAFSLVVIAFLVGVGSGFALTPEYAVMNSQRAMQTMELGPADRNLDLRYVDGMIAHHMSAIDMLKQAQANSKRQEVHDLATTVIHADEQGITQLYAYKKDWYNNERQVTQFNKVQLGAADDKFDLRLLNALITHHEEAITLAKEVRTKSTRTEVLNLADEVITSLSANSQTLEAWRKEWYGIE